MNIICRKTNCKFNRNFVCYAHNLDLSKNAKCDTFQNLNAIENDSSKKLYKVKPKYDSFKSCKKLKICCSANCQFNKNKECHANGITVNSLEEIPYCITYFKKIKN